MAGIAVDRLWRTLSHIDQNYEVSTSADIAEATLDAWSIVDAAHRLTDLIDGLPGLSNAPWRRIFRDRMDDAIDLRDRWQHQVGEAVRTVERRDQAWGALAWAQHSGPNPTGKWFLAVAGTHFKGSSWMVAGPFDSVPREDTRRIRLLHADRTFYLARAVRDIFEMIGNLEETIFKGQLRLHGEPVNSARDNDSVTFMVVQAIVASIAPEKPDPVKPSADPGTPE